MKTFVFFLLFLPIIAVSFLWCQVKIAWHMGVVFAKRFADWVRA